MIDFVRAYTTLRVDRYEEEQVRWLHRHGRCLGPESPSRTTIDRDCNLITLAGWGALLGGIAGTTIAQKYNATNCRIGIGSNTAAPTPGQIVLNSDTGSGSTTSYYQLVSTVPVTSIATSPATLVFTAQFGGTVANFPWNEFGTDNGNASGVTAQGLSLVLLNCGQSPQGTKPSGETWVITETIQFGYPAQLGGVS